MKRRSFLAALAAPFLVRPTLDEIERLTWKRTLFPAYPGCRILTAQEITAEVLKCLLANLHFTREVNQTYLSYVTDQFQHVGLDVRAPARLCVAEGSFRWKTSAGS